MARNKKIETIIREKIAPYTLNEKGQAGIAQLIRQYPETLLLECIDIGTSSYFSYDQDGNLTYESVEKFLSKLGGIAYNKSRSPIDQEISYIKNRCKKKFDYWNSTKADEILRDYIKALESAGLDHDEILGDLQVEVASLINRSNNWSQWSSGMLKWIEDIRKWDEEDDEVVEQLGTVIPDVVMKDTPLYIQKIIMQINASYENNLYDCCAVMMRRLLEVLLVLTYQKLNIESEIMDKNGSHHITLDKIIRNAEQNTDLALSANTKRDMQLFKDLGNFSAHKIWYNCTQQDIKPHVFKYRVIIEELMYKSGVK